MDAAVYSEAINVRLPAGLRAMIAEIARRESRSEASVFRQAAMEFATRRLQEPRDQEAA